MTVDVNIDLGWLSYVPFMIWGAVAVAFTALLAMDMGRRAVERPPAAPWKYVAGAFAANLLPALLMSGLLRGISGDAPWELWAFTVVLSVLSGASLASMSVSRRRLLDEAREVMRG